MAGKVPPLKRATKSTPLRDVISYEVSPLFRDDRIPRYIPDTLVRGKGLQVYTDMMNDEQVKAVVRFKRDATLSRGFSFRWDTNSTLD